MFNYHDTLPPEPGKVKLTEGSFSALRFKPASGHDRLWGEDERNINAAYIDMLARLATSDLEENGATGHVMADIAADIDRQLFMSIYPSVRERFVGAIVDRSITLIGRETRGGVQA